MKPRGLSRFKVKGQPIIFVALNQKKYSRTFWNSPASKIRGLNLPRLFRTILCTQSCSHRKAQMVEEWVASTNSTLCSTFRRQKCNRKQPLQHRIWTFLNSFKPSCRSKKSRRKKTFTL